MALHNSSSKDRSEETRYEQISMISSFKNSLQMLDGNSGPGVNDLRVLLERTNQVTGSEMNCLEKEKFWSKI